MSKRKLLIVEDEFLIAEDCALTAEEAGFEVAGPYSKLKDVPHDLAGISAAILDLNVCGVLTYPLIDRLIDMNIPVTLYTGYRAHYGPQKYANLPRVIKPQTCDEAVKAIVRQLEHQTSAPSP